MVNYIKYARVKKGLSQAELADKLGVSRPYLSSLERGKTFPKLDRMMEICKVLDAEIEEVFIIKDKN